MMMVKLKNRDWTHKLELISVVTFWTLKATEDCDVHHISIVCIHQLNYASTQNHDGTYKAVSFAKNSPSFKTIQIDKECQPHQY
jgi:hypothetical protein